MLNAWNCTEIPKLRELQGNYREIQRTVITSSPEIWSGQSAHNCVPHWKIFMYFYDPVWSLFLNINQRDALNLYNKFISSLYVFRTCSSSGGQNRILQSLVSSHWKSEWSKITKIIKIINIQFYKYEHMVVKFVWIFWVWLLCITYYRHVMTCRGYV